MNRQRSLIIAMAVAFACDVLAYLLLMARLGMATASFPIIAARVLRSLFIPPNRILASVGWSSRTVQKAMGAILSIVLYGCTLIHLVNDRFSDSTRDRHEVSDLTERTIMVMFGDHDSQILKRPSKEKEKVPMFIAASGLEPGRSDRLGSHLDLGPTVLDLLDLEEPAG